MRSVGPPKKWRTDQNLIERDEIESGFRDIVSHPWFIGGRQLDPKRMHMLYTACYNLDTFREFVFESTFLERFELDDDVERSRPTIWRSSSSPSCGSGSPCSKSRR